MASPPNLDAKTLARLQRALTLQVSILLHFVVLMDALRFPEFVLLGGL